MEKEFLQKVLPSEGWYCGMAMIGKGTHSVTKFVSTIDELVQHSNNWKTKKDAYFALASFKETGSRKQDNVVKLRSLFLDIDCGENKPYSNQRKALQQLDVFLNNTELPSPIIVSSGNGLHVYWPIQEDVPVAEWLPLASRLRALTQREDFDIDRSISTNTSQILRIPNTLNFKNPDKLKKVKLVHDAEATPLKELKKILKTKDNFLDVTQRPLDEATKNLLGHNTHSFMRILQKTKRDPVKLGCGHFYQLMNNPDDAEEPYWRAGLSIPIFCRDGEEGIHILSRGHKKYNEDETKGKAEAIKGPYKCDKFDELNPGICTKCKHYGKIKSPIVLGKEVKRANVVEKTVTETHATTGEIVTREIPELPKNYFRAANGGIFKEAVSEDADPTPIYPFDLYAKERMYDREDGDCTWICVHKPQDGLTEFAIPNTAVATTEAFKKLFSSNGIMGHEQEFKLIRAYIIESIKHLQLTDEIIPLHTQFGWKDNYTSFIMGNRKITPDGIEYIPPSSVTRDIAEHFNSEGTYEDWRKVIDLYTEPVHQFCVLAGYGSPLMPFLTRTKGILLHITSSKGGVGKSTVQLAINSIYGNPNEFLLDHEDKLLARLNRMGVMNNLPVTMDEITDIKAEEVPPLVFSISRGRGRHRMEGASNRERTNTTSWRNICISSGNASLYSLISGITSSPDGENMRIFEVDAPIKSASETAKMGSKFIKLQETYGHAGPRYIQYILNNTESVKKRLLAKLEYVIDKYTLVNKERYWADMIAATLVGGEIAKELDLHSFGIAEIEEWLKTGIKEARRDTSVSASTSECVTFINDFLVLNQNNRVVVNKANENANTYVPIIEHTSAGLSVRIEENTNKVYIHTTTFKEWIRKRSKDRVKIKAIIKQARDLGVLIPNKNNGDITKQRLGAGTLGNSNIPAVDCYVFDMARLDVT